LRRVPAFLLALVLAFPALAQFKTGELLEPEKAFRFSARAADGAVEISFAIADGYYMYRDKFRFAAEGNPAVRLGAPEFPAGARHKDELFGEVETYRKRDRLPERRALPQDPFPRDSALAASSAK